MNATRPGMFALIAPVMIFASGRCVARMRCIPAARAFWVMRWMSGLTSLPHCPMRSAASSMMITMYGTVFGMSLVAVSPPPNMSGCEKVVRWLKS